MGGFGATVERPGGIHGRFGLWGREDEDKSSNYRELRNLVETVEEEAAEGHLTNRELWLFTDNSTAESCFFRGRSLAKLLHELVLQFRKAEVRYGFTLHVVHVAGTRMIAQGTDGLSRGILLEGVVRGEDMLSFVDLLRSAMERHPQLLEFALSWVEPVLGPCKVLSVDEWFQEGQGITGGTREVGGIWTPLHATEGKAYIWAPPPIIANVALKECAKAIHKRTGAYHILLIPCLYSPLWMRLFYKLSDFVFKIPPGSHHWPTSMHKPLFVGIALPLLPRNPWSLRGTPLLVGLERQLRQVLSSGQEDGGNILHQLLRTPRQVASVSDGVVCRMLRMSRTGEVPSEENTGQGKNKWYKHDRRVYRINHGVCGAHASIQFQCENCWLINLEGRLPVDRLDDAYIVLLCQANLDAMGGRAVATIKAHATAILRTIRNRQQFRKTPSIPPRGPMPISVGLAIELLFHSLTAVPRIKGESHIQFNLMRRPRATFTSAWESSPMGTKEGSSFSSSMTKITITSCPPQQKWFGLMMQGKESRMGYTSNRQQPLGTGIVSKLLTLIQEEAEEQDRAIAREYVKVGAAIATAVCASLRGSEIFMMELAALRRHIKLGRDGTLATDPMKPGTDLALAPHVFITLLGEFKGELGFKYHLMALASTTSSGIELRWWIETLIKVREEEGCVSGPAFGHRDGSVALMREYDEILHYFLETIQRECPELISKSDDVHANYGFSRTFRRTAEGRARAANLDTGVQNAMNRWKKIKQAKGRCPRFNMVDHYSHARDLMHVTWRYSFVQ